MSNGINIEIVNKVHSLRGWDELVENTNDPFPMMLSGWWNVLNEVFAVHPLYLRAIRNSQLLGVMALYHSRSLIAGNVLRGMDGTISECENVSRDLYDFALKWAKMNRVSYCQFRCGVKGIDRAREEPRVHTKVALHNGIDMLWDKLSSNTRRKIRKAGKQDLKIKVTELVPREFYRIYLQRQRDLGTPAPTYNLFDSMNIHLNEHLTFLSVIRKGVLVGGAVLLRAGDNWLNLYVAVEPLAQRDYASYCLYWGMIEHVAQEGGRILDLGRSRPNSGTHQFKLQFASEDLIQNYTFIPVCGNVPERSMDHSAGIKHEVWKQVPLFIASPLGRHLRRTIPFA